jgi:cathepsin B
MVKPIAAVLFVTVDAWEQLVTEINAAQSTWKAKVPKFDNLEDVKALCGTILKGEEGYKAMAVEKEDDSANFEIPDEFDTRTNWPACASVSGHVRDQSACGSCWAHGSTEAFNDRLCIATGSTALLSTEDTTANCGLLQCFSMGCGGGQPGLAWNWFKSTGVVTGGDYADIGKGGTCAPYSLPSCQHHNWKPPTPEHPACPENEYSTPSSFSQCKESGYSTSFSQDKVKAASSYSISGVSNIQSDIMQYGSVTAAFTVYDDLPAYESGVYHHTSGSQLGGHAVKIIGWGTESGTPYWLVMNSWNEDWGDKGLFKIKRGNNECGIEGQISAGHAAAAVV